MTRPWVPWAAAGSAGGTGPPPSGRRVAGSFSWGRAPSPGPTANPSPHRARPAHAKGPLPGLGTCCPPHLAPLAQPRAPPGKLPPLPPPGILPDLEVNPSKPGLFPVLWHYGPLLCNICHCCVNSLTKHLLSTNCILGPMLGPGDPALPQVADFQGGKAAGGGGLKVQSRETMPDGEQETREGWK